MADFVQRDALQPLTFAEDAVQENFGESIVTTGSVDGTLYGLLFKAANKSTIWYNVASFADAGVEAPDTWDDLLADAKTIKASGLPAYSIGGADGWTLTDLFENIYLRTAGAETYDKLAKHEIPWTDQSVKDALAEMAKIVGDTAEHRRRQGRRPADRLPDVGRERLLGRRRRRRWCSKATSSPGSRARTTRSSRKRASTSSRSRRSTTPPTRSSAAATSSSCSRTTRSRRRSSST